MRDDTIRRDLLEKYTEIVRLRDAPGRGALPDPTPALRALAARFPGALRELDRLSRPALNAIVAALSAEAIAPAEMARFRTVHSFHVALRGALVGKRWLAENGADERFAHADLPPEALAWRDDIALLRRPPHGKLTNAVVERLARLEGIDEAEVRARVGLRRHL